MPNKGKKKTKNGERVSPKPTQPKDKRTPADEVLLKFLQKEKLVLIADEISLVTNIVPGTIWTVDKRPRIRVYYADQIDKIKEKTGEEKIDIVN